MNTIKWIVTSYYGRKIIELVEITGINWQYKHLDYYKKNNKVVNFTFADYLNGIPFEIVEKLNANLK